MKENNRGQKPATICRSLAVEFLLFLLEPEDTGKTAALYGRRQRHTRFDNRLGGTIKIFFWVGITMLFWGGFPDLCTLVATVLQQK